MDLLSLIGSIDAFVALPSTLLFLGVGVYLTVQSRFVQVRTFPRLFSLISKGANHKHEKGEKTINPFHALLTAMSTTIGMGNVVGPSVAVKVGGPGALFWLVAFAFFGAVTKFTEVMLSMTFRKKLPDGNILGGPVQYLKQVSKRLSNWYGFLTVFLFAGWSAMQSNTLANILLLEGVPKPLTGMVLASIVFFVLIGGIQRIGAVASKLVPIMFIAYVTFTFGILFKDTSALINAIRLIFAHIFSPAAAAGGFLGATVFSALRTGVLRNMYITEAGIGTSSIAHAMADTNHYRDQAILAMFSVIADMILSVLSGLLVIVTGMWMQEGPISNTQVYEIFKTLSPAMGKWVLLASISLFILTTIIGNSFNASQSFASFTHHRGMGWYYGFLAALIFAGALAYVPLVWAIMDLMLIAVAVPHLVGVLLLVHKNKKIIQ